MKLVIYERHMRIVAESHQDNLFLETIRFNAVVNESQHCVGSNPEGTRKVLIYHDPLKVPGRYEG